MPDAPRPAPRLVPALSTCWNSHRHQDGLAMLQEIRQLGFAAVELGHGIRFSLWPGILKARESGLIAFSSLHNFCPVPTGILRPNPNCYTFTDPRPEIRRSARKATEETVRQAARLGARAVVLHLGWAGPKGVTDRLERAYANGRFLDRAYTGAKVQAVRFRHERFAAIWARVQAELQPIVDLAGELQIQLGIETREAFEEFPHEEEMAAVLAQLPPAVVGYWHDFGHAARKEYLGWHDHLTTLAARRSRLLGCHIHDCRRPAEDHLPLPHGEVDFSRLLPALPQTAIAVLELGPATPVEQVIASRTLWNSYVAASG